MGSARADGFFLLAGEQVYRVGLDDEGSVAVQMYAGHGQVGHERYVTLAPKAVIDVLKRGIAIVDEQGNHLGWDQGAAVLRFLDRIAPMGNMALGATRGASDRLAETDPVVDWDIWGVCIGGLDLHDL